MRSRSIITKIAALAVIFILMMSIAGVALAAGTQSTVHYLLDGGTLAGDDSQDIAVENIKTAAPFTQSGTITFTLPGSGSVTKHGFALSGWLIGDEVYPAGTTVTITVYRIWALQWTDWNDVLALAVWLPASSSYKYSLSFSSAVPGATLPADIVRADSAPGIPDAADVSAPENYLFSGWGVESIDWGSPVWYETAIAPDYRSATLYYEYSATLVAQFLPIQSRAVYTLHYDILDESDDPASEGPSDSPIIPSASVFCPDDCYFSGWSLREPGWEKVDEKNETIEGVVVVTSYYEATAEGFFSDIPVETRALYNLRYVGYYADGALFWPDDVVDSGTQPALAGTPYREGYVFSGWKPGTLDWSKAVVQVSSETIGEGSQAYILLTTRYTITVEGSFSPEGELPVGAPQTGGESLAGFAAALALLGAAAAACAAFRRRTTGR